MSVSILAIRLSRLSIRSFTFLSRLSIRSLTFLLTSSIRSLTFRLTSSIRSLTVRLTSSIRLLTSSKRALIPPAMIAVKATITVVVATPVPTIETTIVLVSPIGFLTISRPCRPVRAIGRGVTHTHLER